MYATFMQILKVSLKGFRAHSLISKTPVSPYWNHVRSNNFLSVIYIYIYKMRLSEMKCVGL